MQAFAARCAIAGMKIIGIPALAQGNIIHLPGTSLEVAEACSGIRSLYAFLALGALAAHALAIPAWARIAVFLVTIPLSVAANAFRVFTTGMGAHLIGPETTEGTVHELFGLVVFAISMLIFLLVRRGVRRKWPTGRGSSR
jgi:exosortase